MDKFVYMNYKIQNENNWKLDKFSKLRIMSSSSGYPSFSLCL